MAVVSFQMDVKSAIPAARMFRAFFLEGDKLIPKAVPQAVQSVVTLEGDGGPGSIRQINFGPGSHFKFVKERIDVVDKENLVFGYTVIESDAFDGKLEKISNEIKIEATADGGSVCKNISKYYPVGETQIKEEEIRAGKEKAVLLFKAIEAYLLANLDA